MEGDKLVREINAHNLGEEKTPAMEIHCRSRNFVEVSEPHNDSKPFGD